MSDGLTSKNAAAASATAASGSATAAAASAATAAGYVNPITTDGAGHYAINTTPASGAKLKVNSGSSSDYGMLGYGGTSGGSGVQGVAQHSSAAGVSGVADAGGIWGGLGYGPWAVFAAGPAYFGGTVSAVGSINAASYLLNGVPMAYESPPEACPTWTGMNSWVVGTGQSVAPKRVQVILTCVTAELGYVVGHEVHLMQSQLSTYSHWVFTSATSVAAFAYRSSSGCYVIPRADTGVLASITAANWTRRARMGW